jgi:hypothetical protein
MNLIYSHYHDYYHTEVQLEWLFIGNLGTTAISCSMLAKVLISCKHFGRIRKKHWLIVKSFVYLR